MRDEEHGESVRLEDKSSGGARQEGGQPDAHGAANRHGQEQLWLRDMPLLTLRGTMEISLKERRRLRAAHLQSALGFALTLAAP